MGGQVGERCPAGTLTLRESPTIPRRRGQSSGCDRAWGRVDVPVAPPSVRGADKALAKAAKTG